jgi:hypothetical protein
MAYVPALALIDHAPKLGSKHFQLRDSAVDRAKMTEGDAVGLVTRRLGLGRQRQELPDVLDLKP